MGSRGRDIDLDILQNFAPSKGECMCVEGESFDITVDRFNLSQYVGSADTAVCECNEHRP